MLAALGIVPLVILVYLRPQEVFSSLAGIPFLYLFTGVAALGLILEIRLGRAHISLPPQMPWLLAFLVWIILATVAGAPGNTVVYAVTDSVIATAIFFLIAMGAQSLRGLRLVATAIVGCTLMLTVIGLDQRLSTPQCILLDESNMGTMQTGRPDGRDCETAEICYSQDAVPGAEYACEYVGVMATTSVKRRIRYRGILQDPNELAMAIACGFPLLFALALAGRRLRWQIALALGVAGGVAALIFTQSRSGQLVFVVAFGVYFVRRFGLWGMGVGALMALPALLLGGRSSAEADTSVEHRLESWQAGYDMLLSSPLTGVGKGMFVENNFLTAHNSYILAAAELGIVGYLLWAVIMYLSFKIPFVALRSLEGEESATVRIWAMAIFASMCGISVAMLFLSLTYHYVPWIYLGLSGALYTTIVRHKPNFRVRFGWWDLIFAGGGALSLLVLIRVYLRIKGY